MKKERIEWNLNETLKHLMEDMKIYIEVNDYNSFNVMIDGQTFYFESWSEYVMFIKGFKYALQICNKQGVET